MQKELFPKIFAWGPWTPLILYSDMMGGLSMNEYPLNMNHCSAHTTFMGLTLTKTSVYARHCRHFA